MPNLLDFFAQTHTPYLHARGRRGTAALLDLLNPAAGQRILEIGFGTGQTLVQLAVRAPGAALFGVEKSPLMLAAAQKRLRFCGLQLGTLVLYKERLPYPEAFFDTVFCESVLAIVPDEELPGLFFEIHRVLKPGGRFCCNESLWLPDLPPGRVQEINRQCLESFGIVQASGRYAYPEQWQALAEQAGLLLEYRRSLKKTEVRRQFGWNRTLIRSELFSRTGWLKRKFLPAFRKTERDWRERERVFSAYEAFLEGWLFGFKKGFTTVS